MKGPLPRGRKVRVSVFALPGPCDRAPAHTGIADALRALALFLASLASATAQIPNTLEAIGVSHAHAGRTLLRLQLAEPAAAMPLCAIETDPPTVNVELPGIGDGIGLREVHMGDVTVPTVSVAKDGERMRLRLHLSRAQFAAVSIEGNDVVVTLSDKPLAEAAAPRSAAPPPAGLASAAAQAPGLLPTPARSELAPETAQDQMMATTQFGAERAAPVAAAPAEASLESRPPLHFGGYYQFENAYTAPQPAHWSKLKNRLEAAVGGAFSEDLKWKLGGGVAYDAIYELGDFYPIAVRKNETFEAIAREVYLDWSAGDFDFRFGRQQIIWGEVVSLFVADVVSALDLREFVLPQFDLIRIPQWALRGEYFKDDFHAEAVWVPVVSVDNVGKPGSDFYQYPPVPPPGYAYIINDDVKPATSLANSNYGARVSYLKSGWDGAAFYYRSTDITPTYFRTIVTGAQPAYIYDPAHTRIWQAGATLSKDFESYVVRIESVYTANRNYSSYLAEPANGVIAQNTFDYIVSLDVPLPEDARLNAQFFQRFFTNYNASIGMSRVQSDMSFLVSRPFNSITPELLVVSSVKYKDWMVRPRVTIALADSWRLAAGADIFGGIPTGYFGQFRSKRRAYVELRRSF